jgi:hypothetical protein
MTTFELFFVTAVITAGGLFYGIVLFLIGVGIYRKRLNGVNWYPK